MHAFEFAEDAQGVDVVDGEVSVQRAGEGHVGVAKVDDAQLQLEVAGREVDDVLAGELVRPHAQSLGCAAQFEDCTGGVARERKPAASTSRLLPSI